MKIAYLLVCLPLVCLVTTAAYGLQWMWHVKEIYVDPSNAVRDRDARLFAKMVGFALLTVLSAIAIRVILS